MRTRNWFCWILRRLNRVTACGCVRVRAPAANDVCDAGLGLFFFCTPPTVWSGSWGTGRRHSKFGFPDEDEDSSGKNPQNTDPNLEKCPSSGWSCR